MFPYIYLFGQAISTYAIAAAAGILLSGVYLCKRASALGKDVNDIIVYALLSGIGVLVGAHLLYGIVNYKKIALIFCQNSLKATVLAIIQAFGGMVFYGGLFGGLLVIYFIASIKKLDFAELSDIFAPMIPLLHGFARIGCFLGGCCYGVESKFGFLYANSLIPQANGVVRFPVQLLESFFCFGLFLFLNYLGKKQMRKGNLLRFYFLLYGAFRFADEFLRGDVERGMWGFFSTSQWISLALMASVVILWISHFPKYRQETLSELFSNEDM